MIIVSIAEQMLYHRRRTGVWYAYPVSTATAGIGHERNSLRTPAGKHRICAMIGEGMPAHTVFIGRQPAGVYIPGKSDPSRDWILGRILWLDGMELGKNKRGRVDTKRRYIYIHGTHDEARLGTPVSHGCIRMSPADMLEVFEHARTGERVLIR
ncbi:MAG: L,D-transpeptidase [Mariprofundaceae bacterium]|nr:L,D-transpeptidase [Mariprofundaceae bacterium]